MTRQDGPMPLAATVGERVALRSIPGSSPGGPARPVWRWPGWRGPLHASQPPMGLGVSPGGPGGVEHRDHRVAVSCRCRRLCGRPCSGGSAPRLPRLLSGNDSYAPVTSETSWRVTCAASGCRAKGRACRVSHALIPAICLLGRLDAEPWRAAASRPPVLVRARWPPPSTCATPPPGIAAVATGPEHRCWLLVSLSWAWA